MDSKQYVIGIDQSTQGTKVLLFDEKGQKILRRDKAHKQYLNEKGWVSHDGEEIYWNVIDTVEALLKEAAAQYHIEKKQIKAVGISNQRETSIAWDRRTGEPAEKAIVWQCSRAAGICEEKQADSEKIRKISGLQLSPYFPAAKYAWLLQNVEKVKTLAQEQALCLGTIDSFLVFRLTGGNFCTDVSNASRTQLFDIENMVFSGELCKIFGVPLNALPQVLASDAFYGETDFEGILDHPVPIHGVLGDSHAALFSQNCQKPGEVKATYGTGSSIMMNVGDKVIRSKKGLVSSVGYQIDGKTCYVLEGNLNYTGAVITWLKKDMGLILEDGETEELAKEANPLDETCFVPAFSGLGAPYWRPDVKAAVLGMSRTTGKAEFVKAALSSIAQQISDIVELMTEETGFQVPVLKLDGGPTKNAYLMQLQSDLLGMCVQKASLEELSCKGTAIVAGRAIGLYDDTVWEEEKAGRLYAPVITDEVRKEWRDRWKTAIETILR
mgnify:FL=1